MIQYIYLKDNLPWQGLWSELRSAIQMWRKELKLSLLNEVNVNIRVQGDGNLDLHLSVPDFGCDTKTISAAKLNSLSLTPVCTSDTWKIFASGAEWIGENAALNSLRVTNMETMEEALWCAKVAS